MSDTRTWIQRSIDRIANAWGYIKEGVALTGYGSNGLPAGPLRNTTEFLKAYGSWVYACVKARSLDVSRLELRLYQVTNRARGEVREVTDHDVLSLLRKVNPWMTSQQLWEYTQSYKDLAGEAFWYLQRSPNGRMITGIWILRPDWMDVNVNADGTVKDYTYRAAGLEPITIPTEQIVHHREFNPLNPYRGMSVVAAAALTVDSDTYAERFNARFFQNSAVPGVVLKTPQKLDADIIKRMRAQWDNEYNGADKAHRMAILEGGLDLQPFTLTQRDMEFLAGMAFTRDKILALFQVPKVILGMTEGVQVSNAYATDMIFAKRVVKPLMGKLVDALNEYLLPLYGEDLYFEFTDPTPEDRTTQLDGYTKLFATGAISPNEIREAEGHEAIEGLDYHYLPMGVSPIDGPGGLADYTDPAAAPDAPAATPAPEPDADEQGDMNDEMKELGPVEHRKHIPAKRLKDRVRDQLTEKITGALQDKVMAAIGKQQKDHTRETHKKDLPHSTLSTDEQAALWKGLIAKTDPAEAKYRALIRDVLVRQRDEVMHKLNATKAITKLASSQIDGILFNLNEQTKITAEIIVPFVTELMATVGNDVLDALGLTSMVYDQRSETMRQFLGDRALKGIRSMHKVTRAELRGWLVESVNAGSGIPDIAAGIEKIYDAADSVRAERIARTEVLSASNQATLEAYKQSNVVVGKQWYTAEDEQVCEWCAPMDQTVLGIDDDFFDKGTTFTGRDGNPLSLDFENVSAPPLHPNCRCTLLPITISQGTRAATPDAKA